MEIRTTCAVRDRDGDVMIRQTATPSIVPVSFDPTRAQSVTTRSFSPIDSAPRGSDTKWIVLLALTAFVGLFGLGVAAFGPSFAIGSKAHWDSAWQQHSYQWPR